MAKNKQTNKTHKTRAYNSEGKEDSSSIAEANFASSLTKNFPPMNSQSRDQKLWEEALRKRYNLVNVSLWIIKISDMIWPAAPKKLCSFHLPFLVVPKKHTVSNGVGLNGEATMKILHISLGKVPITWLSRTDNLRQDEEDGATACVLQHYTDFPRLHNFDPMS